VSKKENFSHRVKNLRVALGLNQEAFANRLGVSRNYISMIEGGRAPSEALIKYFETIEREHFGDLSKDDDDAASVVREESRFLAVPSANAHTMLNGDVRVRLRSLSERSGISEDLLLNYAATMYLNECESKKQIIIPML
jgi:transcriptional regulator with XRE-family HTH domain